MPYSLDDIVQKHALLQAQLDALPPQSPAIQRFDQLDDVNIGVNSPLADGDVATYDAAQHAWTNAVPGSGGLANQGLNGQVQGSLVTINLDGTTQTVPWSIASGSGGTWLVSGSIVQAGVYAIGILFGDAAGASAGAYVSVITSAFGAPGYAQGVYAIDAFQATFTDINASHSVILEETLSLAAGDLPLSLNNTTTFYTQNCGGALTAIPYIWRLAA